MTLSAMWHCRSMAKMAAGKPYCNAHSMSFLIDKLSKNFDTSQKMAAVNSPSSTATS